MSKFLPLRADEVQFTLSAEYEDTPVRGNLTATDDPAQDKRDEDEIIRRLDQGGVWAGDVWAWCCVTVTASWKGYLGITNLGACSYEDQADFEKDSCYSDMKHEALDALNTVLEKAWSVLRTREVPWDYETCGECGFDHGYESREADAAHAKLAAGE